MGKVFHGTLARLIAISALSCTIIGCSSEEDSIVMAPVPDVSNQLTPTEVWSTSIGHGVGQYFSKLRPVFAYDKVFVANRDGGVKALDPKTGKIVWQRDLQTENSIKLSGGICAGLNKLFIGSENGLVYALNAETGEQDWQSDVGGEVLARPTTESSMVLVNTSEGALIALDEANGRELWSINTEVPNLTLRGDSSPATVAGGVFWGTANGRLAGAIAARGQLIWQQPVGIPKGSTEIDRLVDVDSSPLVLGGRLYIVGYNGQLVAVDLRSGKPVWKRNYSSALDMATDDSRLFVVTSDDYVVAVDARSGTELWKNKFLEHRLLTAPVVINNHVVVGDSEGYLYWLDRKTGDFIAKEFIDHSGFAVAPIVLPDGYLLVTRDGNVKKLKISE